MLLACVALSPAALLADVLVSASLTDVVTRSPGGIERRFVLTRNTKLLLNGQPARPENLNPGMQVTVRSDSPGTATVIEAVGKGKLLNTDETQLSRVGKLSRPTPELRERRTPIGDAPEGRIISRSLTALVVASQPGKPPITYRIDGKTTVSVQGNPATLEELRPGMDVDVTLAGPGDTSLAKAIDARIPEKAERK